MTITRVSKVLASAGINVPEVAIITDAIVSATCPSCNEHQALHLCQVYESGEETRYKCKNECGDMVVVMKATGQPVEGGGYRLKDYVIQNKHDMYIHLPNGRSVLLPNPATP